MAAKPKSEEIHKFVIHNVEAHPRDVARLTAEKFGITRQAVNRHLKKLAEGGIIEARGKTREREYSLRFRDFDARLTLAENRDEDRVWQARIGPHLAHLPENVLNICYYGFTEMFNNVIDHSEGTSVLVGVRVSAAEIGIGIADDGVGIFEKIKRKFNLDDHRHAILELSKGKLTTDPQHHTGEGIFFASRLFDKFNLSSSHLGFVRHGDDPGWLVEKEPELGPGTQVVMRIAADSPRTAKEVFDRYADPEADDYGFSKTHVPLILAKYGRENLVSRSQAKRVLARFEKFREVLLDFAGIGSIGQAFADEIFRVFAFQNPGIQVSAINYNEEVGKMISRARLGRAAMQHLAAGGQPDPGESPGDDASP